MEITIKEADEALRAAIEQRIAAGNADMEAALKRIMEFVPECGFPSNVTPVGFSQGPLFSGVNTELDSQEEVERLDELGLQEDEYREREGLRNPNLPFFCEAYLYELVGKSDARTILSLLGSMARALGYEDGLWGMRRAERIAKEQLDER